MITNFLKENTLKNMSLLPNWDLGWINFKAKYKNFQEQNVRIFF